MERNHIIGFILIFSTLLLWTVFTAPSAEELERQKFVRDSIAMAEANTAAPSTTKADTTTNTSVASSLDTMPPAVKDSMLIGQLSGAFGPFAPAAVGKEEVFAIENEDLKLEINAKGAAPTRAIIKKHLKTIVNADRSESREVVTLLDNEKNSFGYNLQVVGLKEPISTTDLYFTVRSSSPTKIELEATAADGGKIIQSYEIATEGYQVDYNIRLENAGRILNKPVLSFQWVNFLNKLERGESYEQNNSTVYFKESSVDDSDYCSCTSDDLEEMKDRNVDWVSNANQFFNTSLIAKEGKLTNARFEVVRSDLKKEETLKKLQTNFDIDLGNTNSGSFGMTMYVGPNEYERLAAFDNRLEQVIPFGSSIFGTFNRYVIRPMFDFLSRFVSSKGMVIILLIFIIKMLLYPLLYKMLYSQAKMGALKPELDQLKAKFKDDAQKQQIETMKLYQEYGVSPFGGCLPMLLQMPIWIALYRFFPASITFRQESFLWAPDLSSFDAFFLLPFEIPFMGDHLSLFTLLWAVSTVVYTYYSSRHMDMSANPAMKYVQYFMPLMFLGFFNTFAAGLTCYMFFSNLINIGQTLVTKHFIFDDDKIRKELEIQKSKPKKKGGFQARLEEAMKQQQKIQADKEAKKK